MQSTVTFIGYKKESLFPILEYLADNGNNQQLVTLDVDEFFFVNFDCVTMTAITKLFDIVEQL